MEALGNGFLLMCSLVYQATFNFYQDTLSKGRVGSKLSSNFKKQVACTWIVQTRLGAIPSATLNRKHTNTMKLARDVNY